MQITAEDNLHISKICVFAHFSDVQKKLPTIKSAKNEAVFTESSQGINIVLVLVYST